MGSHTIMPATSSERQAILALAAKLGMFDPQGASDLADMLDGFLAGEQAGSQWLVARQTDGDHSGVLGVALIMPEMMTERTFNLQFIAVDPEVQSEGVGSALLAAVEADLVKKKARLLIVETSSLEDYEPAHCFYAAHGFVHKASIADFYQAGEDKLVFTKALLR